MPFLVPLMDLLLQGVPSAPLWSTIPTSENYPCLIRVDYFGISE
jgi:hypothetical protein